ncbi:MAG: C10 family peptidase [Bacteroidales bacterium]|nr:C10 family peptidase [Bacteroidales bacterium]
MKTKILLFFSVILLFPLFTFSQFVTEKQAKTVAKNFFYEKLNLKKNIQYEDIELQIKQTYVKNNNVIFRVFEPVNQKGFILVSSDESIIPILGYSTENRFGVDNQLQLPPNVKGWLDSYTKQVENILQAGQKNKNSLWSIYSQKPDLKNIKPTKDVLPLLTTTWNQGCGYNSLCPIDSAGPCNHVWAGCVATAMAQVMNYHEHPVSGEGSYAYTHYVYGEQSADFGNAVYDWTNMPDGSGNTEISKLIYHFGVSVNMNYSPSGSGSYSWKAANSLVSYFKYSSNLLLTSKSSYTETNWTKLLRTEIDEGRPMYYHGYGSGGHAFNVDGYQGVDYFHFNWGWGGAYNGYFYLNNLNPAGHNYSNGQGAIIGIIDRDIYPGLNCASPVVLTAGVPYSGTTTTAQNIVNKYGNSFYHSTGKEVVHQITTTFPGRLRASLTNLNDSILDVFILSDCNQDSLLAYGDTTAFADNTAPGTYLIIVDGRNAYEGNYALTVTVPTSDPDLIITNQSVVPNKIEAGGIGQISFKVKNIGNSSANASKTDIYYSEDVYFDASDVFVTQINIPTLSTGSEHEANQSITIPVGATEGVRYILFITDAENDVTETDEIYNTEYSSFEVPPAGVMDCSSSVSLTSGVWYFGNTETDGIANVDSYPCYMPLLGKEVVHSITAVNSGLATIEFTEKVPGQLNVLALTSCNENTCLSSFAIWNPEDTVTRESVQVFAGVTYYFVVDAEEGVSGAYGIKIKMPDVCPDPYISSWGDTDLCTGKGTSLFTDWAYTDIQWYKDNVAAEGQTWANIWAAEPGIYKVEVTENGCSAFSENIEVRINPEPDSAVISASGDTTFCEGSNVNLDLSTGTGYTIQWMKNGNPIEGESALTYIADETGTYTAEVTNISCSVSSNTKEVTVNPVTANIGEQARVNANNLVSWFSCDINDNTDLSGNGNDYFGVWNFPADRNGIWNKASYYNGQWDAGRTTNTFNNPNVFTISLWIQTNTNSGGMILGFGDAQWGASTICDRMIYMDDAGKLYFGLLDGTAKTVSTTGSYNDNSWHLLTASLSASGMKLYIDGVLKAEDITVTNGANYNGWWKIGYDEIDVTFPNVPSSMYFRGVVDEIKIYERELLPEEIAYLFEENSVFTAYAEQSSFCESGTTNIILNNAENIIEYQLRNDVDNSSVGSAVTGNANTINLPTGTLTETTTFNVFATNPVSGCSNEISELFTVSINALPTSSLSGSGTICDGETTDIAINLTGTAPWIITYTDGTNSFNETASDNPFVFTVSSAGTYEVTALTDAFCNGVSFTGNAAVVVNDLPIVNLGEDVNITTNESVTLDAGTGFISYLWSDNSTEQTLFLEGSTLGVGIFEYSVSVEDINICENSDTVVVNVTQAVSVENLLNSGINIFPNPTNDILKITFDNDISEQENVYLKVINSIGQEIINTRLTDNNTEIGLKIFGKGIYFIEIISEKQVITKKIIVR